MRAVIQRVLEASVVVDDTIVGQITEPGLLVYLGVTHDDTDTDVAWTARKIWQLRLLRDEDLILQARDDAFAIVSSDPKLERHPVLRELVASALDEEQAAYLERG